MYIFAYIKCPSKCIVLKKWFGSEVEQVLTKWETEETAISTIATPKTPNTGSHELCIHPSFIGIDGAR